MSEVRITETAVLGKGKTSLTRYTFERQTSEGQPQKQSREIFDHGNAATVLLYNPEEKTVVLTRQFRLASYLNGNADGTLVETPAGLLEEGEAPEQTMMREIKEETGYAVSKLQKIYEAYSSAGAYTELIHFYTAAYTKEQKVEKGGGLKEEGEDIKVLELPFAEALRMLNNGEIKDLKTILLLHYAQVHNLL